VGGDALLGELRASRERLLAAIAGVSEEQFKRRPPVEAVPTAGEWSIAEVLAHLFASEQRACARVETSPPGPLSDFGEGEGTALPAEEGEVARARMGRGRERAPELTDEERSEEARRGRAVPVPQIIHGLLASRRRLERAMGGVAAAERGSGEVGSGVPGSVEGEPGSVAGVLGRIEGVIRQDVIEHEGEHTAQIEAVKAALRAGQRIGNG
jgi:DinB family protein